jgi:hypothetical protein
MDKINTNINDDFKDPDSNNGKPITVKDITRGYTIWSDRKNITRFLENVWVDAIVRDETAISNGGNYTYNFNWEDKKIYANVLDSDNNPVSKINYDISIYQDAYQIMEKKFIEMIKHYTLPNYVWDNLTHKSKKFHSQVIKTRDRIGMWFYYFDTTDEEEFGYQFNCPDFWLWYKYPGICYELLTDFGQYGHRRDCLQILYSDIKNGLLKDEKQKEYQNFINLFPTEELFKAVCSLNKKELKLILEGVYFDE